MKQRPASVLAWLWAGLLSVFLVTIPASAHDVQLPISGDDAVVRGEPAVSAGSEAFSFSSNSTLEGQMAR